MSERTEQKQAEIDYIAAKIRKCWGKDTASPSDAERWSPKNPALGQCAVTALLVNQIFGGIIMRTMPEGHAISHYYNILPDGEVLDLTKEQFGAGVKMPRGESRAREYLFNSPASVTAFTMQRYLALVERYIKQITDAHLTERQNRPLWSGPVSLNSEQE